MSCPIMERRNITMIVIWKAQILSAQNLGAFEKKIQWKEK